jgi:filamentous hemagglutinin family protein
MSRHGSLNHVFRLIWSHALNRWIPVAETMCGKGRRSTRPLIAASLSLTASVVAAGPLGGQVITGTGTITQSGATTTILQASQTLSLNWKSFNIAPQETVDFVQPSVTSIAVNRIFDVNGTQILGHLDANGLVYLINPNGIVFGRGAQVDVGGLVASTLDLNDPTLGGDTKTFSGSGSGSIVNDGTLTAGSGGYVALLANKVSNQGTISAQLGSVAVGAGSAATLTFAGNRLVHMQVDQGVLNALAENSGVIRADGGQVLMTAGAQDALLASVVNNTGLIEANTVENHGGSIALMGGQAGQVVVKGTLDASSATGQGGEIVASGETVSVGDDARVTATGATGGGGISIGGGWQGGGGIAQATSVYVSNTATLDASATGHGNGGEVVVRSDVNDPASATRVYGTLLARGGPGGGDGGRIETSGHWLDVTGIAADASAASGAAGEWLLDPYNVIIGSPVTGTGYTPPNFTPSANSTILASAINTALTAGTSVTINTGTYGSGSSLGDITVNTAISKTGGGTATLTLQAADSIIINQPITSTSGALNVNLWADNDGGVHNGVGVVLLYNSITTNGGAIAFGTNSTMAINGVTTLVGGDVYVGGTSAVALSTSGGAINLYGQLIIANTGGFNLNSANGSVMFAGLVDSGDTYAFVSSSGITWTNALTSAKSGLGANVGDTYLATITSRLENAVAGAVAGYASSWLGASRVTGIGTDAVWRWVTGPEGLTNNGQGLPFFTQNGSATTNGNGGTAIGVSYTNWNNGEPNNSGGTNLTQSGRGEWVMQFTGSQGQWNDLSPTNSSGILGYVQETNLAPSALYVNAGTGLVTFAAAIGSNKSLSTLNVTGGTIALPSPLTVNTTGAQTFTGQVTVGGNPVNVLTVSAPNLSTTYGLGVPTLGTPTYSGFVNGNTIASLTTASTESTTATAQPNAGSYPISLSVAVDPNYYILYNPGTLIVNLATLSITASSSTKTYRAANPALTVAYSGLQYSDTTTSILTTLPTATTAATTASNAGTYATTAAGAVLSSSNYTIAYVPGALTVTPAPLTVTGLSGTARPYNGLTSDTLTGTGVLSGLQNGETLTLSNATNGTLASANAGSEGVTTALTLVAGTGSISNYTLTQPTLANVLIGQAPLTVTGLTGTGRTYNGLTSDALTGTGVLAGLQNSETLTLANTTTGTLASANAGSEPVTTALALVAGTGSISNYTLTQPTLANVLIGQAPLTVTGLTGTARTYDGTTIDALSGTGTLSGLVTGEALSLVNAASGTLASANAGSEPVTTAITLGNGTGGLASNYSLTQPTLANVLIGQAPLTVTGLAGTARTYDGTTIDALSGTGTLSGLVTGEALSLVNAASGTLASANAGSEPVTTAITLGNGTGGLASNYSLTQPTLVSVAIAQAPLTVIGTVSDDKIYDRTTTATLTSGSLNGVFSGDTVTLTQAGNFASRDVGTGIAVTASDTLGGAAAANYLLTQPTGLIANITPKELGLSLSGDPTRVYDGTTSFGFTGYTTTLSGIISGDTVNVGAGSVTGYGDKNVGAGKPVTFTGFALGGSNAGDYQLVSGAATSTASITPATIGIVSGITANNKVYDGGTSASLNNASAVFAGEIVGDSLTVAADTASFASKNVATGAVVSITGITLGGADASNYLLGNTTASSTANITQLASVVWIGPATGGSWSNPANWAGGAIPDLSNVASVVVPAGDTVRFDSGVAGPVNLLTLSSGGLDIAGGTLNVASALNLTNYAQTGGTIGGPGNFTVIGAFSQTAGQINMGPGSVAIDQSQGNLSFADIAGGAVNLASPAGSVTLGSLAASGNLAIIAGGGAITQSAGASLNVGGTTNLKASDAGVPADVSLTNANNSLAQAVSASGAAVSLTDAGPLTLGTVGATGNLTLASTGALDLGISTVGGNLAAASGNGNVTQDGPLAVTGTTSIAAGTGNIDLSNAANTFAQAVSASGAVISLTDTGPLTLGIVGASGNLTLASIGALDLGISTVGGNLAAASGNGNVTQDGPLAVTGTTSIAAGTGIIQMNNPGNTFGGKVTTSGAQTGLADAGPLALGTIAASGDLNLVSSGALDLGTSTVGGNLAANSGNGNVTQDGPLAVIGTTSIIAGTGIIQVNNPGNAFGGKVSTTGSEVSIVGQQTGLTGSASAASVVAQLESSMLASDIATQPGAMSQQSPIFNEVPSTGSAASGTTNTSSSTASSDAALVNVTLTVGVNGPALKIVNGGVRLPDELRGVRE